MRRIVTALAAIAALMLAPAPAARAETGPAACRLDFWTWQGGYAANGTSAGQLALTMPAGATVTYSWNAQVTTTTITAAGQFGFGGSVTGAFGLPSGIPSSCVVTIDGRPAPAVIAEPDTLTASESGGSATFTVRLSSPPASGLPIMMRMSGTGVWAMPPILITFSPTDWDRPKSMTMYAAKDADTVDDVMVITLSAPGYLPDTVTLTQIDSGAA